MQKHIKSGIFVKGGGALQISKYSVQFSFGLSDRLVLLEFMVPPTKRFLDGGFPGHNQGAGLIAAL